MSVSGWSACNGDEPRIPTGLIDSVCDVLGLPDNGQRPSLRDELRLVVSTYLRDKVPIDYASPKAQRALLRKLRRSIERSVVDIMGVAPEYVVALDTVRGHDGDRTLETACEALIKLHESISKFDELYHPPKGPIADVPLEEAVRDLCWLFKELTGEWPRAKMNKHTDCRPELATAGARAIGLLLKGADPALNDTKIANMIEKVRDQSLPSLTNLDVLIRIDPDSELDASLLDGRRGD